MWTDHYVSEKLRELDGEFARRVPFSAPLDARFARRPRWLPLSTANPVLRALATLAGTAWRRVGETLDSWAALARRDPFVGLWEAVTVDGSHMRLRVGVGSIVSGGSSYHLVLRDDRATSCPSGGPAEAVGLGNRVGDSIEAEFLVRCVEDRSTSPLAWRFTYDSSAHLLVDLEGVAWGRRRGGSRRLVS
jgi:hypothetical protein